MEVLLDILTFTIPSVLVLLTAIYVMKTFLTKEQEAIQQQMLRHYDSKRMELLKETKRTVLPIRLQAYERLTLYCSRLELGGLISRTPVSEQTPASHYKVALVNALQEEFNHNITQQMYMTDDLWKIIQLAKQECVSIIEKVYMELENEQDQVKIFLDGLVMYLQKNPQVGYLQALVAIKKEVSVLFE